MSKYDKDFLDRIDKEIRFQKRMARAAPIVISIILLAVPALVIIC